MIGVEESCYLSSVEQGVTQIWMTMARYALGAEVNLRQCHQTSDQLLMSSDNGSCTMVQCVFTKSIDDIVLDLGTIKLNIPVYNDLLLLRSPMMYDANFFSTASVG